MIVTLSHRGYIKRTAASEYRVQGRGGKGVRGMETRERQSGKRRKTTSSSTSSLPRRTTT